MSKQNGKLIVGAAAGVGAALATRALVRRWREYDFRHKTVVVTGGSRGLGLLLARELVSEGAQVAIAARDAAELERARADLTRRGGRAVLAVPCDVTERAQVNEMIRIVRDRFGRIDVLVNNAGVIQVGPVEVMTVEDYEEAFKTHFWGPLYTTLSVLPEMRRRGEGRIVNISSIGGKISVPHLLPYSASKFALVGFSAGMRAELAKDGVVVTTVCPGLIRTGSPRNAFFKGNQRAEYAWFSISDSLPLVSMSAERAARQIISACKRGDAEVVLSLPAELAAKFYALFPGLTQDMLGVINRLLPEAAGGGGTFGRKKGKDSSSPLAPSMLTTLSDRAARRNNEMGGSETE